MKLSSTALGSAGILRANLAVTGPWSWPGKGSARLTVRTGDAGGTLTLDHALAGHQERQDVAIVSLPGTWGGRQWFLACACGARARDLYLPPNGTRFACVRCHGLSYASRQKNHRQRTIAHAT